MLHDSLTVEEVVDSESALEFMKEATKLATSADLEDLSERIARKAEFFGRMLEPEKLKQLTEDEFGLLVRQIFSIGRKSKRLISANGFENLREQIQNLLNEDEKLDGRFDAFVNGVRGVEEKMRINFAGELLHFSNPRQYWLWTNWIWDPDANTGSLPLVVRKRSIYLETPRERPICEWGKPWHRSGRLVSNGVFQIWDRVYTEWMFSWPVFMRFTCTRFFESNYPMNSIESSPTFRS